jgi:hypothetical protein
MLGKTCFLYKLVSNHSNEQMKVTILIVILLTISLVSFAKSQNDSLLAKLVDTKMVSDGISRYSEPKISPNGTKILTSRNLDTLIYIDLENNSEFVLLSGGRFMNCCWIDSNTIYYQKRKEIESVIKGEIGRITLQPLNISVDYTYSQRRNSGSANNVRIPSLLKGKYDLYFDLGRKKIYQMENGKEIEITHESGIYYGLLISNYGDRLIVHKNDGRAYNYDLNATGEYHLVTQGLVSTWSPDDRYLLYFQDKESGVDENRNASELYICTSDGIKHQQLTFSQNIKEFYPDWSKESNKITFIDDNNYQIYISSIKIE